jgi:hypothetical protein
MSLTPVAGVVFRSLQQMIQPLKNIPNNQSVIGRPCRATPTIPQLYTVSTGPNLSDDGQDYREDYTRTKVVCD